MVSTIAKKNPVKSFLDRNGSFRLDIDLDKVLKFRQGARKECCWARGLDSARNVVIVIVEYSISSDIFTTDTNKRNNGTIIFSWTPTFP